MQMKRMAYRDLDLAATTTWRVPLDFLAAGFAGEAFFLNGARMPSIAEEVATDNSTLRCRWVGSRRYGLESDSLVLMNKLYSRHREA